MATVPDLSGNSPIGGASEAHLLTPGDASDTLDMPKTGGTFTGKVSFPWTSAADINLGSGSTPGTLIDGDIWMHATGGLNMRVAGATRTLADLNSVQTFFSAALKTFAGKPTFATSTTAQASCTLPHGVAPTGGNLVNGDVWTTTAGLFCYINGVVKTVTLT